MSEPYIDEVDQDDLTAGATMVEAMRLSPFDPNRPRGFEGAGEALKGWLQPSAAAGRSLLMAGAPIASGLDTIANLGPAREDGKTSPTAFQDAYFRAVDDLGTDAVDYWTPNVAAMGGAARTLNMISSLGGAIPQMVSMPEVFLTSAALDPATTLVRDGVDADTAMAVGGVNLAVNAIGLRLPAAMGTNLATRVGTGAASNLALGAAADAGSEALLERGGYDEQASAYDVTDPYARGLDLLLGAAFGGRAHLDALRLLPSQRDAALVASNAEHFTRETMPGTPKVAGADVRHQSALRQAIGQFIAGEPVNVADAIRVEDYALRPELLASVRGSASPGALDDYPAYRRALESGGRADARNPNSSAFGADQFTAATWRRMVAKVQPEWAQGLSDAELLAARGDPDRSAAMASALDQENAAVLDAAGIEVNRHTLYAAHHFGPAVAKKFARAADDAPIETILAKPQLEANPYLAGKTKAEVLADWDARAAAAGVRVAADSTTRPRDQDGASLGADPSEPMPRPREAAREPDAPERFAAKLGRQLELDARGEPTFADGTAYGRDAILRFYDARVAALPKGDGTPVPDVVFHAGRADEFVADGLSRFLRDFDPADPDLQVSAQVIRDLREARPSVARELAARLDEGRLQADEVLPDPKGDGRAWLVFDPDSRQARTRQGPTIVEVEAGVGGARVVSARILRTAEPVERAREVARRMEGAQADGAPRPLRRPAPAPATTEGAGDATRQGGSDNTEPSGAGPASSAPARGAAEYVGAARTAIELVPELRIPTGDLDVDGNPITVPAHEWLAAAEAEVQQAGTEALAIQAAADCFLRSAAA